MHSFQVAFWVVALLVVLALLFDFMNGFHDAANSIATVVSTGVLKPHQAVAFAAFFNVLAIGVFQLQVAATVGKGIVIPDVVDHQVVFGALIGAIAWNIVTWWYGIPSSSSHALIGGIVGAVIAKTGPGALIAGGVGKTVLFIFVSPLLGFLLASLLMVGVSWLFRRVSPLYVDNWFRRAQLVSAGLYSLGHGGNDAQKTIGIIWMLLIATGYSAASDRMPPAWVIWSCYIAIGLGTMFGGWRIVKTMGQRITKLKPVGGFCAEPTPTIAPVMVCVVDTGMPNADARKSVIAPPVSAQKPPTGLSLGIFWPIVFSICHPPKSVPSAIATKHETMTQLGGSASAGDV